MSEPQHPVILNLPSAPSGVEVCLLSTGHLSLEELTSCLPVPKADEWSDEARRRFRSFHRQKEWLGARLALQHLLPAADICYLPSGRPLLRIAGSQEAKDCISISHTHGIVGIAKAHNPIGMDLEQWSGKALRVAHKFLNPQEMDTLDHEDRWTASESTTAPALLPDADGNASEFTPYPNTKTVWKERSRRAIALWTIKEAAFKFHHRPDLTLMDFHINRLTVTPLSHIHAKVVTQGEEAAETIVMPYENFALCLCYAPIIL